MKSIPLKQLIYLPVLVMFLACNTTKKTIASNEEKHALPELPQSEMDIPIQIAAAPVLAKAEKLVPTEFTSDGWPELLHPSCDFRYKYRFVRTNLQISSFNNLISIRFGGNYQVSGSKCLCTAGIPVTPWISGQLRVPAPTPSQSKYGFEHKPQVSSQLFGANDYQYKSDPTIG